jgi:carboxypeptidase D
MVRLALSVTIASAASALASFVSRTNPQSIAAKRAEAIKRLTPSIRSTLEENQKRATSSGVQNITFSNPTASRFYVDGANFPEVNFDFGPSWAGLLPISGNANETRKLFFWFFPPGPQGSLNDLIFW